MGKIHLPAPLPAKNTLEKTLEKGTATIEIGIEALQKLTNCVILLRDKIDGLNGKIDSLEESIMILTKETTNLKTQIELHKEVIHESIQTMEKKYD